jgi:hypothetical protein
MTCIGFGTAGDLRVSHDPQPPPQDIERVRHELNTALTVLHLRTELLERQLRRRDGLSDDDRAWLAAGLAGVLASSPAISVTIKRLPTTQPPRDMLDDAYHNAASFVPASDPVGVCLPSAHGSSHRVSSAVSASILAEV